MIQSNVLDQVARAFRADLSGSAFISTNRKAILCRLRETSSNNNARLTESAATQIQYKLREQGIDVFPEIASANGDNLRLYRMGTCAADIARLILHPTDTSDRELANLISKAKGRWDWPEVPV